MKIISSIKEMSRISRGYRAGKKKIGFVPTMGALHGGHLSLIHRGRLENDILIVSIFVNPAQFGPGEDFRKYPRDLSKDAGLCRRSGVDIIFHPHSRAMYPDGYKTNVYVADLSERLCGKSRPGHFKGVATVVTKLLNIVCPDNAYFGQKDAQQAVIIRTLARDLNIPVRVRILPTVRQAGGLALSSRNQYLNSQQRQDALVLYGALKEAKRLAFSGITNADILTARMRKIILEKKSAKIDYIAIVNQDNLMPLKKVTGQCLIALAVWIGKTRLIDNLVIKSKR